MNTMKTYSLAMLALFSMVSTLGCGGPVNDMPEIGSVEGTLTLDGEPIAGATVSFYPVAGGRSASGLTDEEGKYTLQYNPTVMGTKIGENVVTISTFAESGLTDVGDPSTGTGEVTSVESPGRSEEIPEKYRAGEKLTVIVEAGENVIDLPLTRE